VGALLEDVRDLFEPLADGKDIRLVLDRPADLPLLRVDQRQMTRVLSNLVGNALKFTPDGGTVTIRALRADGEVWFEVRDNGRGIPAEHLERVFDRFWQADQSDRRGAGLGLAIAKGIVEAHGGRVWVESRVGEGSSFFVALPVSESSPLVPQARPLIRPGPSDPPAPAARVQHTTV
jgi:signal transduction histidine kinase